MNSNQHHHIEDCEYRVLRFVKAGGGEPPIKLGRAGQCRYCGTTDTRGFQTISHAMPEALGNKWVTSLDECDDCNRAFAPLDDALVKSIGAALTVGGTPGKGNRVRQTGRSKGSSSIVHQRQDGRRHISMSTNGTPFGEQIGFDNLTGELVLRVPTGTERFIPALAYKALSKMGFALLPEEMLEEFTHLRQWLSKDDDRILPHMIAGLSFASIGNAPRLLSGALLVRKLDDPNIPYMLFVMTIGSICFQIVMKTDRLDGEWPSQIRTRPSIKWANVLAPPGETRIELRYGNPVHIDLGRNSLEPPLIETVDTRIKPGGKEARMVMNIRQNSLAATLL